MKLFFLAFLLFLLQLCIAFNSTEDDLVFVDDGDESSSLTKTDSVVVQREDYHREQRHRDHRYWEHKLPNKKSTRFSKANEGLWDESNRSITIGHVFKLKFLKRAFGQIIQRYEVHVKGISKGFPSWLYWDELTNTLLGIPSKKDIGKYNVIVKAFGKKEKMIEKYNFIVTVIAQDNGDKFRVKNEKNHCKDDQSPTQSTILLDVKFENLNGKIKVETIEKLAEFLGLHTNSLSMQPYIRDKYSTVIQWQSGCDERFWKNQEDLIYQLPEQKKNKILAKVLQLPVIRWQKKADLSKDKVFERNRRDAGSGDSLNGQEYDGYDDDNENYDDDYDEDEDEDNKKETVTENNINAQLPHVSSSTGVRLNTETESEHPHRHHHGEETIDLKQIEEIDEHDIVPIFDHGAASGFNNSSTSTTTTTTTTSTTTIATSSTTTTTTSTDPPSSSPPSFSSSSISSAMTTQSSLTESATTRTIIHEPATTTTMATPSLFSPSTPLTTSNGTVTGSETVTLAATVSDTFTTLASTILPTSLNTTDDFMEKPKQTEDDSDIIVPIDFIENVTTLSSMDVITTFEKQPPKVTVSVLNVTSEEPTEETTIYSTREETITPSPTVGFSTFVPNVLMNTTVVDTTTTQQTQKTFETSSSIDLPSTTTTTVSSLKPVITVSNSPPVLLKRIQKIPVLAGKSKIQLIASDTFRDDVDGYTRNLQLSLSPKYDWIELNNDTQELYMIPLVKDISRHFFKLTATNSRGLSVSEDFEVYVQQPSKRVQFEFHLYLDILHRHAFSTDVDWKFRVIENLAKLFEDNNHSNITFTDIHMENSHRAILSWTNDTLSNSLECPAEKIEQILHVLVDKNGNPSSRLKNIFLPSINVTNILNRPGDHSQCSNAIIKYAKAEFTTETPVANYNPILRNQIDRLNCTLGQLFVFKVPEDTFFDKKDGSTRELNLSLRNSDGSEISPDEWLQFDSKNQEFYGVPMKGDIKQKIYHLEARDKEGLAARDSLKVHVSIPPMIDYSVEFSMTLEIPFEDFAKSAKRKRLFIEKVCELFGDSDTSTISLESITRGSTVVTWRNTTLATRNCPNEEIDKLRKVVVKEDKTLTDRVDNIMGNNAFPVKQITLTPLGSCLGELTGVHKPDSVIPPFDDSRSVGATNDEYLITFVLPAIIILTMLILAGIIACIFYKRRRSGKMSISEQDDERQSFRNKGIPVIFQDELDEKPDPGNKSPIILKEEKPPLPPPEYQKSEDGADVPMLPKENSEEPYQPPPPFATNRDNNRQNRPKPTPTYRKPPPYVPP